MAEQTAHNPHDTVTTLAPRFLFFPIAAAIGQVLLMIYGPDLSWPGRILAIVTVGYLWFNVAGSFHETVHQTLFRSVRANLWYGRAIGTFVLIPYTAYKESHRLHHAYLNTPDDTELWPYSDPTWSKGARRVFAWVDLCAALLVNPVIYGRVAWMKNSRLKANVRRKIRIEYVAMIAIWIAFIAFATMMVMQGRWDANVFHPLWLTPLAVSYSLNTVRKFTEHLGLGSLDQYAGTRTVIGPGLLTRLGSYFNFDIYIHGPHHRYPRAKHYELPDKLREIQAGPGAEVPIFRTYRAAMMDMLPSLLHNPGVGLNVSPRETVGEDAPPTQQVA